MAETRDVIRERQLSILNTKYDKLTGTWTWETYQANAIEHENLQILLEDGLNQKFAGTADLEHLKVIAYGERGIVYKEATFATGTVKVTATIGATITIGDLFANELQQYEATETVILGSTGIAYVKVQCTVAGSIGNTPINTITQFPKTLTGINTVTNLIAITDGYEEEGRTSLLERYYLQVRQPSTSGNVNDYIRWATEVTGVGAVKVKPVWAGGGSVKIVILDSNRAVASQELIDETTAHIITQSPIGATVTVVTASELTINITCKITLTKDYTLLQATTDITKNINAYFKETAFVDSNIYYAKVGNLIFNSVGVNNIDYTTFNLNSSKNDIILIDTNSQTQIAKLGTLAIII